MENKKNESYSVIIPVYNSNETIAPLCAEIVAAFNTINASFEIIIVNDGGNISTWEKIQETYTQLNCKMSIIRLSKNYGQHNATLCGIKNSSGNIIITIDDDLQVKPSSILTLIKEYETKSLEIVYGVFKNKKHSLARNIGSNYIKKTAKYFMDAHGKGSSFRLFTRAIANKILEHSQSFVYIDELLLWYTDNVSFVEIEHYPNRKQKSRYSLFSLLKMSINITTNYTALPLKLITYLGLTTSLLSFLLGIFFIYRKIFKQVPLGYTSVIVTVLFSTSLILFSLGILGQYIYKLYQVQNKKPTFSVQQKYSK